MIKRLAETPGDQDMIDKFQRAFEQLRKHMDEQNKRLKEENERLKKELEEYRKRHPANIGVKNGKPYVIPEENKPHNDDDANATNKEEKRKPGAQKNHKGHYRIRKKITDRINVHSTDSICPSCSSTLVRRGTRKRVIEDIPEISPKVTQYRIDKMYCNKCKKMYEPEVIDALPKATFSLRTMLTVAYFRIGMRMSIENVKTTMDGVFGIVMSEGEVQNILSQLSDNLGEEYEKILSLIREAASRNMDSTTYPINGITYNLWTFLTKSESIFIISRSNSHVVPLTVLGDHKGTDIHDRHSAFETFAEKTGNDQQYCWSHINCDGKELEGFYGEEGGRIKRALKKIHNKGKAFKGHGTMEDVDKLYQELVFLLDTDYEHLKCRNFVKNLLRRKREWLFAYVMDPEVESTNNRAERALRQSVIYRKVSGGSRTERGADIYARLSSIYYTSKLRKNSFIKDTPDVIKRKDRNPKPG
ncbi:MAG: IS66 family transposase [Thermoplasmataceae archaeon]